jgi:hypothetical protein
MLPYGVDSRWVKKAGPGERSRLGDWIFRGKNQKGISSSSWKSSAGAADAP